MSCLSTDTIPSQNLPICLTLYSMQYDTSSITNVWNTITTIPTNKQKYRVWFVDTGSLIHHFHENSFSLRIVYEGDIKCYINWEKFPITGTVVIGSKQYIVNSKELRVNGNNYQEDKSLEIKFEFKDKLCVNTEKLMSLHLYIYDNPCGIEELFIQR